MPLQRILAPFVDVRKEEAFTALLMFVYSFLAMTAYNIIQPLTRSKVIQSLGAVNVPWVILGSGLIIGVLMVGYTKMVAALPRRWALPITQGLMAAAMVAFWFLFRTGAGWVSVAFYVWGALLGILLISQFWTLANGIYDPRQAKRLFGFVGGGVMLGGMTGSGLTALIIESVGTNALLLWSSGALILCMGVVSMVLGREQAAASVGAGGEDERGVTMAKADRAAARVAPDSDHRAHHQLRVHWRGPPRPAGQHGDGNLQGRRPGRLDRRLPGADPLLHLIGRVRHPGLDHAAYSSLPGHRVRAVDAADQPDASPRR